MNEYKITYSVNGKTYTTNRVEHTEATAKRAFLKDCKEMDIAAEVLTLELIRDDACATKQQERDTLEAIRKMIAELGPQSYLATAFEGCFEDAEANIENDFGDSWKRRCESVERRLDEAEGRIKALELDNRDLRAVIAKLKANLAEAEQALKDRAICSDDLETIRRVLENLAEDADHQAENAAAEIVRFAEAPGLPEFQKAVAANRNAAAYAKSIRELLGRVVAAETATHANPSEAAIESSGIGSMDGGGDFSHFFFSAIRLSTPCSVSTSGLSKVDVAIRTPPVSTSYIHFIWDFTVCQHQFFPLVTELYLESRTESGKFPNVWEFETAPPGCGNLHSFLSTSLCSLRLEFSCYFLCLE